VPVHLIAADERIARHRHPLPTLSGILPISLQEKAVKGYVMVVGCFLREGLVVSMTRFKRVAEISPTILDAYDRVCAVDAIMQEQTVPGKTLGDVFAASQAAYKTLGFPENEWHNHHQGGTGGYAARTFRASPVDSTAILDASWPDRVEKILGDPPHLGQAFAWNPSAVGVKSEDTFLLTPDGKKEIITATPSLPRVDLERVLGRKTEVVKYGVV
jgi:antitoxin VapB